MLSRPRHWIVGITGFWCLACTIPVVGEGQGGRRWEREDTWRRWDTFRDREDTAGWREETGDSVDTDEPPPPVFAIDSTQFTCTDGMWKADVRTNAWSSGGEVRVWAATAEPEPPTDTGDTGSADTDSGETDTDTGDTDTGDTDSGDTDTGDTDTDTGDPDVITLIDTWPFTENVAYDPWGTWDEWGLTVHVVSGEPETGTTVIPCERQTELTFVVDMSALNTDEEACVVLGAHPTDARQADEQCD